MYIMTNNAHYQQHINTVTDLPAKKYQLYTVVHIITEHISNMQTDRWKT